MSDEIYGDPQAAGIYWEEQSQPEDCVEMSMADVVGQVTGREPTEAAISSVAESTPSAVHQGAAYDPEYGTYLADAPEILAKYGVSTEYFNDKDPSARPSGLRTLESALRDGGKPIVAVDAQKIWDFLGDPGGPDPGHDDHAVVVTGIDAATHMVYLNDSGVPNGREEAVPLNVFMAAWSTSGHEMVVASTSSSDASPAPASQSNSSQQHEEEVDPFSPAPPRSEEPNAPGVDDTASTTWESSLEEDAAGLAVMGAIAAGIASHRHKHRSALPTFPQGASAAPPPPPPAPQHRPPPPPPPPPPA